MGYSLHRRREHNRSWVVRIWNRVFLCWPESSWAKHGCVCGFSLRFSLQIVQVLNRRSHRSQQTDFLNFLQLSHFQRFTHCRLKCFIIVIHRSLTQRNHPIQLVKWLQRRNVPRQYTLTSVVYISKVNFSHRLLVKMESISENSLFQSINRVLFADDIW